MWTISEDTFQIDRQPFKETIFTIGNGYLGTRGAFEEGYPGDHRATLVHGVFDDMPIVFTELANAPDWLPVAIFLDGERFTLASGTITSFERRLDLKTGLLTRKVEWRSSSGKGITLTFERFASLTDEHLLYLRCQAVTDFDGVLEFRLSLNGNAENDGFVHWQWIEQGQKDAGITFLHSRTRKTAIEIALAMRLELSSAADCDIYWDAENQPTRSLTFSTRRGEGITIEKYVGIATSRDTTDPVGMAMEHVKTSPGWENAFESHRKRWQEVWDRIDVVIDGDEEAQLAIRASLFQLYIAGPRNDDRVNIGAKTLSGLGYRGHSFWDTETFMLPVFIYTAPEIARNLLNYRHQRLPAARENARKNGFQGAQFPWESADTGEEVTPTWVPHYSDRTKLIRIWTGDIEMHISADIAYAACLYWKVTGDDDWFIHKGAEIVLDTAKFWASRAEWNEKKGFFEYCDVIGPDEYHEHVDNDFFTNYMARWNLQTALQVLSWLTEHAPTMAEQLGANLDLTADRLAAWQQVSDRIYLPARADGLIEQFDGYFQREDVDLAALEPRTISAQMLFGIEGCNQTQVLKQPDVLMLQYLMWEQFSQSQVKVNYDYYNPRTDLTFGSSLGPSIQAIIACRLGKRQTAYKNFMRAARADLKDIRGNTRDGIHGASAGGIWQALVFGFAGLKIYADHWEIHPCLPAHWKRLAFHFYHHGQLQTVDIQNSPAARPVKAFIFDLDGVLVDTAEYHYRAWKRLADDEDLPFDRTANEALRGISRRESLMLILNGRTLPEETIQEMMERKNRYYLEFIREVTTADLLPGVCELLNEIHTAGMKSAIGSASKNTCQVLEQLGILPLFDAISDGYSVENPKPAPDLFLHAAAQLGFSPAECVVVEDAAAGIQAAQAGGFLSIGLGPDGRVGAADLVFPSLDGIHLEQILEKLE